ncbi:hypothetical protein [Streptomyces sp. NPDC013740]|uniref:hypothetical protein n=1 Tax=Streptomyces sp. NPDC013740 TaxID=3364867 RepID=UPI0036FB3DEA
MKPSEDVTLWTAYVEAHQEMRRRRFEFYEHSQDATAVLRAAIAEHRTENEHAALAYTRDFVADVALLPVLVDMAMTVRYLPDARHAIANIPRPQLAPALEALFDTELDALQDSDADYYGRWAELLVHLRAWPLLARLAERARASASPEVQETAAWITAEYGPMLAVPAWT